MPAGYITNLLLFRHPLLPVVLNLATNVSVPVSIVSAGFVFQVLQSVWDIGDLICRRNT